MAVNKQAGDKALESAVKKPSQVKTPAMDQDRYSKRLKGSGQLVEEKQDGKKFKGVRKEH